MSSDVRADKIDAAMASAGELIAALEREGPLSGKHVRLIVEASVRSVVPNFQPFELRASAERVCADLGSATK
jgi:hypothetical protein